MLKNYLKIAWRTLFKNKGYSLVATLGLAVGIACFILVGLYILFEFSYESHHEKAENIYRVGRTMDLGGSESNGTYTAGLLGPTALEVIPEVRNYVQLESSGETLVQHGEVSHYESPLYFTGKRVFEVFTIPFVTGNPDEALSSPRSIVISEAMAQKYFGSVDPIGKTLTIRESFDFTVTGVIENPPEATNIPFHFLAHLSERQWTEWQPFTAITTYLLMEPGIDVKGMEQRLLEMRRSQGEDQYLVSYKLDRLDQMHLYASINPTGDIRYIYIFVLVAFFLLLIANINYINLSIAQFIPRSREVGIRKTLGARRWQLTQQYLTETFLISVCAIVLALLLTEGARPLVDALPGITLAPLSLADLRLWGGLAVLAVVITVLSGSYVTFYLARLDPASIFQKRGRLSPESTLLRQGLITFQFAISIALICCTFIVQGQLDFIRDSRLGFDKEHMLILEMAGDTNDQYQVIRQKIEGLPGVQSVSATNGVPSFGGIVTIHLGEEHPIPRLNTTSIGPGFLSQIGTNWLHRPNRELGEGDWVLNASAAEELGMDRLEGQRLEQVLKLKEEQSTFHGEIAGIVEDFHFQSLRSEIKPIAMQVGSESFSKLAIRFQPGRVSELLEQVRAAWEEFAPGIPISYAFLDDRIESLYQSDRRFAQIFWGFSLITILIACMGLFGLAALAARRRTKEIGIRKVLGASVSGIVVLLGKDFIKLVGLGFLVAVPASYYVMSRWLADFAYRIDLGVGIFALAGAAALLIALATVSWQSIRAATANPVESLRTE